MSPSQKTKSASKNSSTFVKQVEKAISVLPERTIDMALRRLGVSPFEQRPTLQVIGDEYSMTRERIRQLVAEAEAELAGLPPKSLINKTKKQIGHAVHRSHCESVVKAAVGPKGPKHVVRLAQGLLYRACDLTITKGWVLAPEALELLTRIRKLAATDLKTPRGIISKAQIKEEAKGLKIDDIDQFVADLLEWIPFENIWMTQESDSRRVLAALWCIGKPATKQEIADRAGLPATRRVSASLGNLGRFSRTSIHHWALSEWVDEPYEGVIPEITRRIRENGGSIPLEVLIEELPRDVGTSESTVRTYAGRPVFKIEDGIIRETTKKEQQQVSVEPPSNPDRHFQLPDGRWGDLITLKAINFRGYSLNVSNRVAFANGVAPQTDKVVELKGSGHDVSLIWRITNTSPTVDVGRVTKGLKALGFKSGDKVLVIPEPDSVEVIRFKKSDWPKAKKR